MESLLHAMIYVGPATLLLGLAAAIMGLALQLSGPGKPQAPRWVLATAALGVAGFMAGTWAGIAFFCSGEDAGNLCGLGGMFGTGPLVAGLVLATPAVGTFRARRKTR